VIFFWRDNSVTALGLKQPQLTSIVVAVIGMLVAVCISRSRRGTTHRLRQSTSSMGCDALPHMASGRDSEREAHSQPDAS